MRTENQLDEAVHHFLHTAIAVFVVARYFASPYIDLHFFQVPDKACDDSAHSNPLSLQPEFQTMEDLNYTVRKPR
jgi:hypothetical protein